MTFSVKRGRPYQGLEVPITVWVEPSWREAFDELTQTTGQSRSALLRDQLAPLVRPKPLPIPVLPAPKPKPLPVVPLVDEAADEAYWAEKRAKHCPPELAEQLHQQAEQEARQRLEAQAREAAYWAENQALRARIVAAEGTPPAHNRFADRDAELERLRLYAERAEKDLAQHVKEIAQLKEELSQMGQPLPVYPKDLPKQKERELLSHHLFVWREVKEHREKLSQLGGVLPNGFASPQQELQALKALVVEALKERHQQRPQTTAKKNTPPPIPPAFSSTKATLRPQPEREESTALVRPGGRKPRGRDPD